MNTYTIAVVVRADSEVEAFSMVEALATNLPDDKFVVAFVIASLS